MDSETRRVILVAIPSRSTERTTTAQQQNATTLMVACRATGEYHVDVTAICVRPLAKVEVLVLYSLAHAYRSLDHYKIQ